MLIGVPRETHRHEHRVGLSPFAVATLARCGHTILVENRAGEASHFSDAHYERAGARIVFGPEEAYGRADLVCRVGVLSAEEIELLRPGTTICGFLHLAVAPRECVHRLSELGVTLIGYELIRDAHGDRPVLFPFSEMAGKLAVQLASYYLQNEAGGRGILIGNVPGIPPPTVLILGAGTAGCSAARQALASGAHAIILDSDMGKLAAANAEFGGRAVSVVASEARLQRYTAIADVVIGAILIPGERAPFLVTESMVREMKPGSVIIDVSIDQGGCVETSRPTTLDNPTFVVHDVIHYCVPNMTANIARTASRALVNAALPYLQKIADLGTEGALEDDAGLCEGIYLYRGRMASEQAGSALGVPSTPLRRLMEEARAGRGD